MSARVDPARPLVLMLRALGLGDLLTSVPALRAIGRAFPDHRRVLAAPGWLGPIVRLIGDVDGLVPVPPLAPLPEDVHGAAIGVNLHGRGPQSHRALLRSRPRRLIAFGHAAAPETAGFPRWRDDEHEVARWCRLLAGFGIEADPGDLGIAPPWAPTAPWAPLPPETLGATVIHPGAASPARRWPSGRFGAVARAERRLGRRVVVTAAADEAGIARDVARHAGLPREAVLVGRPLDEIAAVVAGAGRVVCGDTGIAHLATAFGTPSVVLFGPTSPARWGPPRERGQHRVLWSGSVGDPHGPTPDPGLLRITVDDVIRELDAIDELDRAPERVGTR